MKFRTIYLIKIGVKKEWDRDFRHMKAIGIDTVIVIRSGYRKFITYPSPYLLKKGCYMPSVDLIDMYLRLADKYNMKFYFGLYDSGRYWDTGDMTWEIEDNKYVIDEAWNMYGKKHKSFGVSPALHVVFICKAFVDSKECVQFVVIDVSVLECAGIYYIVDTIKYFTPFSFHALVPKQLGHWSFCRYP